MASSDIGERCAQRDHSTAGSWSARRRPLRSLRGEAGIGHWRGRRSGMTTHSERRARPSPATRAWTDKRRGRPRVARTGPAPPSVTVIDPPPGWRVHRRSRAAAPRPPGSVKALSASDPSVAWLSPCRPGRREVARSAPASGSSSWGRSTPRTVMPAVAAIQMATTTANPSVSSAPFFASGDDWEAGAGATCSTRRLRPALNVWPSAGLANRRSASPAKVAASTRRGNRPPRACRPRGAGRTGR